MSTCHEIWNESINKHVDIFFKNEIQKPFKMENRSLTEIVLLLLTINGFLKTVLCN